MTKTNQYATYRDSGVEWLGSIPAHWSVTKFRHCFRESSEVNGTEIVGEMLSVSGFRGVEPKVYEDENQKRDADQLESYRVVRKGQLAVNTMWLNYSGLGISEYDGHMSPAYRAYWVTQAANLRYIHHLMRSGSYVDGYTSFLTGIRPNSLQMSRANLMEFPIVLPPRKEQDAIAAFLDRETAQIDDLIAKQERLIELLAEKRQATIAQAVAKGLDPTISTKPSGISWLGDIPADWAQKPMCHFMAGRVDYRGATPKKTDEGIFLVTAKNVRKGFIDYSASTEYVAVEDYDSVMSRGFPAVGDILMTMEAPLGNFALIDDPKVALAQRVIKFRPKAELLSGFAVYAANSPYFQAQLEERATGSTALGLKASKLIELRLVAPSREEQQRIVDFLDTAVGRVDGLTQRARAAISLLSERRSALISAAVTGKINVTNQGVAA